MCIRDRAKVGERSVLVRHPRAAVLLGHDQAEQPQLTHLRNQVGREVVILGPLRHVRGDLTGGEIAHVLTELLVIGGELEHAHYPFARGCLLYTSRCV